MRTTVPRALPPRSDQSLPTPHAIIYTFISHCHLSLTPCYHLKVPGTNIFYLLLLHLAIWPSFIWAQYWRSLTIDTDQVADNQGQRMKTSILCTKSYLIFPQFYEIFKQAIHKAATRWKYYQTDEKLVRRQESEKSVFQSKHRNILSRNV